MHSPTETSSLDLAPASVPCLPESAPFTPEQRAYLNGFLAGLFSKTSAPNAAAAFPQPATGSVPLAPLTILFGSQTGNAEALAKRIAREAGRKGFAPTVYDMAAFPPAQLSSEHNLLVITSTYGDGEPPDNAKKFWEVLNGESVHKLDQTRFSLCALGDSNYPQFCQFGKVLDQRLAGLGAMRVHPRQDCDVDFEAPFEQWLQPALTALSQAAQISPAPSACEPSTTQKAVPPLGSTGPAYGRKNPFSAHLIEARTLNKPGSTKDTRHCVLDLKDSGLSYEPGDALGVIPANDPSLVGELLSLLDCDGEEGVPGPDGQTVALRQALCRHLDITKISNAFLQAVAERSGDPQLNALIAPEAQAQRTQFIHGRDVVDLLAGYPKARFTTETFVARLRPLQPRLYSIASSLKAHPNQVHLCVATVRYESLGRQRGGVCSTFMADRVEPGQTPVPIFVQTSHGFRLPAAADRPIIMIGPGTGIAPFRAFLQERKAIGAKGRTWLFFGDQRRDFDFLYGEELEPMVREGTLTRLDTAFSRDQTEKVYVQHRMLEHARDLWHWLEEGAHVYVCGDAQRMAKDVDAALHQVIQKAGGKSDEQAKEYVEVLRREKRYQRDVY